MNSKQFIIIWIMVVIAVLTIMFTPKITVAANDMTTYARVMIKDKQTRKVLVPMYNWNVISARLLIIFLIDFTSIVSLKDVEN